MAVKSFAVAVAWMFVGVFVFLGVIFFGLTSLIGGIASFGNKDLAPIVAKSEHAVGVVELEGEILTSKKFLQTLDQFVESKDIKAIVVRIDSPGGAVGASEEIYSAIKKAREKKKVVCSLGSMAASGGVYSAMGCEKIIANRGTLTGSIGVIMMAPNVKDLIGEYGVSMTVVKSGKYKDSGSPFRESTADDKKILQSVVDSAYEQFVDVISDERKLPREEVKKFADGRVFTGDEALAFGLIDEHGDLLRAAKVALQLAKDDGEPELVFPSKEAPLYEFLSQANQTKLIRFLDSISGPRLLYMSAW